MKPLFLLPLLFAPLCWPTAATEHAPHRRGPHDWTVDNVHSSVVFRVKHAQAAWFFGTFDKIEGTVTLDPENPGDGSVELRIPVDSVDTNSEQRDGHLKSPDFFNAKANPQITFRSTEIERKGKALHVNGELSMAGKSKSITIPVEHVGDGEFRGKRRGYLTEFTVKRSDFGMTYGIGSVLGDEVTLTIALELVQAK